MIPRPMARSASGVDTRLGSSRRVGTYLSPVARPGHGNVRGTERYGICDGINSLRLDVGRPDHLTPPLGFLSHQLPEFSRRHRHGLAAELGQAGLQLRIRPIPRSPPDLVSRRSRVACPWAPRSRTRCSRRSPARFRRWSAPPESPPRASTRSRPTRAPCRS